MISENNLLIRKSEHDFGILYFKTPRRIVACEQ